MDTVRADKELCKVAAEADDAEVADQATAQLMEQIESGQLSEEDAMKILDEAVKSGAISQEDVQAAMAELQAAGGQAAPAEAAPAGAMPPEAAPAPEEMVSDPGLEAKLAQVDVGPEHPLYQTKLASLYAEPMRAGAAFLVKVAEEMGMLPGDEPKESPAEEKAEHASGMTEEEEKALEAAKRELNLSEEDAKDLMAAPAPEIKSASDRFKAELVLRAAFKK